MMIAGPEWGGAAWAYALGEARAAARPETRRPVVGSRNRGAPSGRWLGCRRLEAHWPELPEQGSRSHGGSGSSSDSEPVEVLIHDSPLTPEDWAAYERAARSYACTRDFAEYFEDAAGASLALVRRAPAGEERAAFLYKVVAGSAAIVLGRFTAPSAGALGAFANAVFARHPRVARVETNLIDAIPDVRALGRPVLAVREATEIRISLPGSVAEYERMLSKSFASQTRYHERRLARDRPSTRFATLEGADIPGSWIADIVQLNRHRMASKNVESVFSRRYEEGIARVARGHGCVTVLLDGSRVCAGVVNILCGPEAFGWVIGHDDGYAKYRPGRLCEMVAIRHLIGRGLRTLHFLHGDSQYKREFGGRSATLATYVVLRDWSSARPSDAARLCGKHVVKLARSSIQAGDRVAGRVLGGTAPLTSLARRMVHRARRMGR
jgi:CelD/BcsL family acetyltransferase involved in cellulose biosynthesis